MRRGRPLAGALPGALLLAVALAVILPVVSARALPDDVEAPAHRVRARHIVHFASFVEWPADALAGRATIDLCVLGDDSLHRSLAATAHDATVGTREVAAVQLERPGKITRCHVLFVADEFHADMEGMVARAQRSHVLLVGNGSAFLLRGGAIAFVREGSRIRFDVDLGAASRAGLKLRSQLVQLARRVIRSDED